MDRDAAQYFAQLQHTCNRQSQAKQAAQAVFQDGPTWHMRLAMFDKRDAANLEAALQMAEKITKLHQLPGREAVHNLCIINWASPGIHSGSAQKAQANLTRALVNGPAVSLGLCLSPVHFYKRGSLYKAEQGCVNQLANAALLLREDRREGAASFVAARLHLDAGRPGRILRAQGHMAVLEVGARVSAGGDRWRFHAAFLADADHRGHAPRSFARLV